MQNKKTYIFLFCSILFFVATLQASGYTGKQPKTESIFEKVNQARKTAGLPALTFDETLTQAATAKARDMVTAGYFNHVSPAGRLPWDFISSQDYAFMAAGENLAINFSDADSVIQAWLASDTHRNNILNPIFTHTGITIMTENSSSGPKTIIVQLFSRPE